ncbi:MAG: hypothetical protein LQ338_003664 [Usnochroma carphineum]|nr:MAG: hypothetical protein LQ338_003664 [Usnochroma carphineum]
MCTPKGVYVPYVANTLPRRPTKTDTVVLGQLPPFSKTRSSAPTTYVDQWDEDGKKSQDVKDEDERFELGQHFARGSVDENGNRHDAPVYHRPLPQCWGIARMVELGEG